MSLQAAHGHTLLEVVGLLLKTGLPDPKSILIPP